MGSILSVTDSINLCELNLTSTTKNLPNAQVVAVTL